MAAFANSFSGVFVFDDRTAIVANRFIRTPWPLTDAMRAPRNTALAGRPIASLSFALTYLLAPADARDVFTAGPRADGTTIDRFQRNLWSYHATNVCIHVFTALALFGVARRTLRAAALASPFGSQADVVALAVATIWVVHPLTTAAVTYIVQRTEALMGLWYLLTLYCAIRARECSAFAVLRSPFHEPRTSNHERRTTNHERRTINYWVVAAIVFCVLGMGTKETFVTAPVMVMAWDFLMLDAPWRTILVRRWPLYAGLAATWVVLAVIIASAPRAASVGFGLEGVSAWAYLVTQAGVIAHYLRLAFLPWPLSVDYEWPIASSLREARVPGLIVIALVAATLWGVRRRKAWSFAGVWFFLILAPTSSVVPIVTEVAADHRMYVPLMSLIAFTALGAIFVCRDRTSDRSERHGLKAAPYNHPRARIAVVAIAAVLALMLGTLTRVRNADYSSQERLYAQTVEARPTSARARSNLASVLIEQGRTSEAEPLLRDAIRLKPDYPDAYANLAVANVVQGRSQDALPLFERAVALAPDRTEIWRNYAEALGSVGRFADAVRAFRRALASNPDDADVLEGLAWVLATAPVDGIRDGKTAVDLARRAAQGSADTPANVLDTLAAAYAENGQFTEAIAAAERALARARNAGRTDLESQIDVRLQLYRSRQPYREPR